MGRLPSAEQGKILWDILRKQENKCEVLADALVSNGEVRKISTDNSELIMTINIRMEVSYRFLISFLKICIFIFQMLVSWRLRILFMRNLHCLFCTPSPQTGDISIIGLSKVLEKAPDNTHAPQSVAQ